MTEEPASMLPLHQWPFRYCFSVFSFFTSRINLLGRFLLQVIGLNNVPIAGDEFEVVDSLDTARARAEASAIAIRDARISAKVGEGKVTLSSIASAVSSSSQTGLDMHQLNLILKVDVQVSPKTKPKLLHFVAYVSPKI